MSWLELFHQAPSFIHHAAIHHAAIHHQTVTQVAVDSHIAPSMHHEESVVAVLALTQKALPQGIFTEVEVEQCIALILAGTVTALAGETAINVRKTLTSQMRNQLSKAAKGLLAKLQEERQTIRARVISCINQDSPDAISTGQPDYIKLKELNRKIEILRKLIDLLNADFRMQSAEVAVQLND